jgi:hypothetical protein
MKDSYREWGEEVKLELDEVQLREEVRKALRRTRIG